MGLVREHDVKQNSTEWEMLRAGIPTASAFDKIVTPTGKLSKSARDYRAWLLAERVMRAPIATPKSHFMDRGTEFEAEAVDFYSLVSGKDTTRIGFVTTDDGLIGASPDRWSGADGQVEIKVPAPHTHMAYFMAQCAIDRVSAVLDKCPEDEAALKKLQDEYEEAAKNTLAREYRVQTMGQLWVTERDWADLLSYSPEGLPPVLVHLKRDTAFIETLARSVTEFSRSLEEAAAELVKSGVISKD